MTSQVYPLRLSHSSRELLHVCERKFQIEKLLAGPVAKEESAHFSYGHAMGAGVATYLATGSKEAALYQCWINYWPVVENDQKTEAFALHHMIGAFTTLDNLLQDYEVAEFRGAPAVELSFKLNINPTKYYVGHIDVVLRHKATGKYFVLEVKTTALQLLDIAPLYKHSGQAVGYSIALDQIVGEELSTYGVLYFVIQLPHYKSTDFRCKYHILDFPKTLVDRLNWFVGLGLDVQHLEAMQQLNIFPQRGGSCVQYNKPCYHYGTCGLQNFDEPKQFEPDDKEYTFEYDLDTLIESHIDRIARLPQTAAKNVKLNTILNLDDPI